MSLEQMGYVRYRTRKGRPLFDKNCVCRNTVLFRAHNMVAFFVVGWTSNKTKQTSVMIHAHLRAVRIGRESVQNHRLSHD